VFIVVGVHNTVLTPIASRQKLSIRDDVATDTSYRYEFLHLYGRPSAQRIDGVQSDSDVSTMV